MVEIRYYRLLVVVNCKSRAFQKGYYVVLTELIICITINTLIIYVQYTVFFLQTNKGRSEIL